MITGGLVPTLPLADRGFNVEVMAVLCRTHRAVVARARPIAVIISNRTMGDSRGLPITMPSSSPSDMGIDSSVSGGGRTC